MLLVVTGASGIGKTTARVVASEHLDDRFERTELTFLGPIPAVLDRAWRQEMVEVAVRRAIELDAEGRHLLLAGDPVPAGEALAAPSADGIDVAVLLLDAGEAVQTARLRARQDADLAERLRHHVAFQAWMRRHATDPGYMPHVVTDDSWPAMRWDRWVGRDVAGRWAMTVLDTTDRTPSEVGEAVADWCRAAVDGGVPVFRAGWHR